MTTLQEKATALLMPKETAAASRPEYKPVSRKKSLGVALANNEDDIPETIRTLKAQYSHFPKTAIKIEITEMTYGLFKGQYYVELWQVE